MDLRRRVLAVVTGSAAGAAAVTGLAAYSTGGASWVGVGAAAILVTVVSAVVAEVTIGRSLQALARLPDEIVRAAQSPEYRLLERHHRDAGRIGASVNHALGALRAERTELELANRLYRSILEGSPNGVLLCDAQGRIVSVNPAFLDMVQARGEPVGRRPTEVFPVPEIQELVDLAGRGQAEGEVRSLAGARFLNLRAIRTPGGEVAILAQDVTRWRLAERARTDFVANVSHELRTPMAAILGYADSLLRDTHALPPELVPQVEAVARNSRRLRDTFEGLMHLARVEARAGALQREALVLEPLVIDAVLDAVDEAGRKGIDFGVDCPDDLAALTNAEALGIILGNLAQNAVKYTMPGGRVWIEVRRRGDEVDIEVGDTGIGIDAAHHDRIFERFFRVDEGRAREIGGSGLGLAMVKHLALATGARVDVRSVVGEGSVFTLVLPHASAQA